MASRPLQAGGHGMPVRGNSHFPTHAAPATAVSPISHSHVAVATAPFEEQQDDGTCIAVKLGSIEPSLPEPLRHKIAGALQELVPVPVAKVIPQLRRGAVTLTVSELRSCAPELLASLSGHDDIAVALPLGDIVRQLDTGYFRRESTKQVDVPEDVGSVFTQTASGMVTLPQQERMAMAPAPVRSAPVRAAVTNTTNVPVAAAPAAAQPKISLSPQALAALAAAAPKKAAAAGAPSRIATPAAATRAAAAQPVMPAAVQQPAAPQPAKAQPIKAQTPKPAAPKPAAVKPQQPARPAPAIAAPAVSEDESLPVPLQKLVGSLPEEVRKEVVDVDVEATIAALPMSLVQPALKSGKVLFAWSDLAGWLEPPLPRPPSKSAGELLIELPLSIIAPIFMAHYRAATSPKRLDVDGQIPDLFQSTGGSPDPGDRAQAAPAPAPAAAAPTVSTKAKAAATAAVPRPSAPKAAAPAPAPAPSAAPLPRTAHAAAAAAAAPAAATTAATTAPATTVESVIGPAQRRFAPKEIVQNLARLPGVGGALIAMTDGLPVASTALEGVNTDTLAAFLPQMFGRASQYSKDIGLGALQSMSLHVEGGCWQVFKQPNIYLAVGGKAGEEMPYNLLAKIAAELSKQTT